MFLNQMDTRYIGEEQPTSIHDSNLLNLHSRTSSDSQNDQTEAHAETSAITIQPTLAEGGRRPVPIATSSWNWNSDTQILPFSGVDFLKNIPEVVIQQIVEINDILSHVEAENKYIVKVPGGDTLFMAKESSHWMQRAVFGSSRGFSMCLLDPTQQVAFNFERTSAPVVCCCSCLLQNLKVFHPSGVLMGQITQECAWSPPRFTIRDLAGNLVYRVVGPDSNVCTAYAEKTFSVYGSDGLHELCHIVHKYSEVIHAYHLEVQFPEAYTDVTLKALILGCGFLLEYIFFEQTKHVGAMSRFRT